ncbi:hypothetical protein B484DRAFT_423186 [Ochromonadaceae sp. CCMP2298]|nr:hypothetical protein B484DRAFT_423186 [Ochromonadaceae sp. CCMP2298]
MSESEFIAPAYHSYLGDGLRDLRRMGTATEEDVDPDRVLELLLIPLPGVVLFPGETIPLRLRSVPLLRQLRRILGGQAGGVGGASSSGSGGGSGGGGSGSGSGGACSGETLIGVVNSDSPSWSSSGLHRVGCTVHVQAAQVSGHGQGQGGHEGHADTHDTGEEAVLMGRGRVRFTILSTRYTHGALFASIRLLPDPPCRAYAYALPYAYNDSNTCVGDGGFRGSGNPHPRWCAASSPRLLARRLYEVVQTQTLWKGSRMLLRWGEIDAEGGGGIEQEGEGEQEMEGEGGGEVTSDPDTLTHTHTHIGSHRCALEPIPGGPGVGFCGPRYHAEMDPGGFCDFVGANLPAPLSDLQRLLACGVVERLRLCLELLQRGDKSLACARCSLPLAPQCQVFSLPGTEGVSGAYVNSYGAVHQTITLRSLLPSAARLSGPPCLTDSWFPGYAWEIACCRRCGSHLGWRFTRAGAGLAGARVAGRVAAAAAGVGELVVGSPPESPEYMYASDQFEYADSGLSGQSHSDESDESGHSGDSGDSGSSRGSRSSGDSGSYTTVSEEGAEMETGAEEGAEAEAEAENEGGGSGASERPNEFW